MAAATAAVATVVMILVVFLVIVVVSGGNHDNQWQTGGSRWEGGAKEQEGATGGDAPSQAAKSMARELSKLQGMGPKAKGPSKPSKPIIVGGSGGRGGAFAAEPLTGFEVYMGIDNYLLPKPVWNIVRQCRGVVQAFDHVSSITSYCVMSSTITVATNTI